MSNFYQNVPPLSLYIHMPWCIKKCPYCDFNSHELSARQVGNNESLYIAALIDDLQRALPLIWGRMIRSVFIGGGTPSLFSGDAINHLLTQIRQLVPLSPYAEITIEANPGTIDNEHIYDYHLARVNRISFGVQSFNNAHLNHLGRIHDNKQAINAITVAKKYFTAINIDLMYGLPKQTIAELKQDLQQALALDINHLSYYNLTIEPNTLFYTKIPEGLPDNDLCYLMQDVIVQELQSSGYRRYETSAYCKNNTVNNQCAHNLNYWQFGDYLGIGAGAHAKLTVNGRIIRQVRHKSPAKYMALLGSGDNYAEGDINDAEKHILLTEEILNKDLPSEFMLNAMRLIDGFPINLFTERTKLSLSTILATLNLAQERGFITLTNTRVVPTKLGQDFLNELLIMFLKD